MEQKNNEIDRLVTNSHDTEKEEKAMAGICNNDESDAWMAATHAQHREIQTHNTMPRL
jgi:hypothetical protein